MSSMLEQAIVDAKALKEAALKNAEAAIIEKYAPEVKKAVQALLEQPEDELAAADPLDMGGDLGGEEGLETDIDAPLAATDGEDLCPCPDEDEPIEVDFEDLRKMAGEMPLGEPEDAGALAGELSMDLDDEEMALEEQFEISDNFLQDLLEYISIETTGEDSPEFSETEEMLEEEEEEEEEEISENLISDIIEKLTVQMSAEKSGWLATPTAEIDHAEELELARRQSDEFKEEKEDLIKKVDELKENNQKLKSYALMLKEKLEEISLSNARLFYSNRVLGSVSLNERQKNRIVDTLSRAGTINEAKVIYETLENSAGSAYSKPGPKSLNEAISKPSSLFVGRRSERSDTNHSNPFADRMKKLAGIK